MVDKAMKTMAQWKSYYQPSTKLTDKLEHARVQSELLDQKRLDYDVLQHKFDNLEQIEK